MQFLVRSNYLPQLLCKQFPFSDSVQPDDDYIEGAETCG